MISALTLDLDDTIWPFAPIGARIEQVLDAWLREHSPRTAERFPVESMRAVREQVFRENPQLHHDMSQLRRMTLERALHESGADMAHLAVHHSGEPQHVRSGGGLGEGHRGVAIEGRVVVDITVDDPAFEAARANA